MPCRSGREIECAREDQTQTTPNPCTKHIAHRDGADTPEGAVHVAVNPPGNVGSGK